MTRHDQAIALLVDHGKAQRHIMVPDHHPARLQLRYPQAEYWSDVVHRRFDVACQARLVNPTNRANGRQPTAGDWVPLVIEVRDCSAKSSDWVDQMRILRVAALQIDVRGIAPLGPVIATRCNPEKLWLVPMPYPTP